MKEVQPGLVGGEPVGFFLLFFLIFPLLYFPLQPLERDTTPMPQPLVSVLFGRCFHFLRVLRLF